MFLGRGNSALTRRATRYSTLHAVVVRFSRTRKRYERQGVLVEEAALAKAEAECASDADAREAARERAAARREELDAAYVEAFAQRVGERFPGCPRETQHAIAEHACRKYSGRVGRSAAAKELQAQAVELAVRAHVRHAHTAYDELLAGAPIGWTRGGASPGRLTPCWRGGHPVSEPAHGMHLIMDTCIFCRIIEGTEPAHRVWESHDFLAFLTRRPCNPGHTLLIPKVHVDYVFELTEPLYSEIFGAAKQLCAPIRRVTGAERIGLAIEGFSVPHVHLHLVPLYNVSELDPHRHVEQTQQQMADMAGRIRREAAI